MKLRVLCLLCVALLVGADDKDKKKSDKDKLQGTWKIVEFGGQKLPAEADAPKLVFEGDKYSVSGTGDADEKGTFKLDPEKKPKTIDLAITEGNDKGKNQVGIYQLDGDKLKVCFAPPGAKDRPKDFKSTEDSMNILATLERDKK